MSAQIGKNTMKTIEIYQSDFERLKLLSEPLVDTTAIVINRLINKCMAVRGDVVKKDENQSTTLHEMPPLTHTKLLAAHFNGKPPEKNTWDSLLKEALKQAIKQWPSFSELTMNSGARLFQGVKSDEGYKFLPNFGISYQGVSAEDAMRIISTIACGLKVDCELKFQWRLKQDAYMPGKRAEAFIFSDQITVKILD